VPSELIHSAEQWRTSPLIMAGLGPTQTKMYWIASDPVKKFNFFNYVLLEKLVFNIIQ
jgi:hypothetical protein